MFQELQGWGDALGVRSVLRGGGVTTREEALGQPPAEERSGTSVAAGSVRLPAESMAWRGAGLAPGCSDAEVQPSPAYVTPQDATPWEECEETPLAHGRSANNGRDRTSTMQSEMSNVTSHCTTFWGMDRSDSDIFGSSTPSRALVRPLFPEPQHPLDNFPPVDIFLVRSRTDTGDAFKALRHWARRLDHAGLAEAGTALDPEIRKEVFAFVTRICERRFYSAQGRETLKMLLGLEEWSSGDGIVDDAAVEQALGKPWTRPPPPPTPPPPQEEVEEEAAEQAEEAAADEAEVAEAEEASAAEADAAGASELALPVRPEAEPEEAAPELSATAAGDDALGPAEEGEAVAALAAEAVAASAAVLDAASAAEERPSAASFAIDTPPPTPPKTALPPEIESTPPEAFKTFPQLEAFRPRTHFDSGDTFKEMRRWVKKAAAWDLAAVGSWLDSDQRRDVISFLTRICKERPLYRAQSRELLTALLSAKEWAQGDGVIDEFALSEVFFYSGRTPKSSRASTRATSPESHLPPYLDEPEMGESPIHHMMRSSRHQGISHECTEEFSTSSSMCRGSGPPETSSTHSICTLAEDEGPWCGQFQPVAGSAGPITEEPPEFAGISSSSSAAPPSPTTAAGVDLAKASTGDCARFLVGASAVALLVVCVARSSR